MSTPVAVFALLHSYYFSDPGKILKPKLDFLVDAGFAGPSLHRLLWAAPAILTFSLEKHLGPCIDFLRGILSTDDNMVAACSCQHCVLLEDLDKEMRPAVEALWRHSLTEEAISWLVLIQIHGLNLPHDRIGEIVKDLRAAGLQLDDKQFLRCFAVLYHFSRSTWERKIARYKSFGFSGCEIFKAFRMHPAILNLSDESIENKPRFFLHKLKLNLVNVVARPLVLTVSLESTVLPRCAVLSVLMREGEIAQGMSLPKTALAITAQIFVKSFASKYRYDVPDVLKAYEGEIEFQGFPRKSEDTFLML